MKNHTFKAIAHLISSEYMLQIATVSYENHTFKAIAHLISSEYMLQIATVSYET